MLTHTPCRLLVVFLIVFCSLIVTLSVAAQDEAPPPQFLYYSTNQLTLVNGYTGETHQLPFAVSNSDRFRWSPDGKYLQVLSRDDGIDYTFCLNLYDVDALAWLYDEPLACGVEDAALSFDSARLVYTTKDVDNGVLWLYNFTDETTQEIYRTTQGTSLMREGITEITWSPTEAYLTFVVYDWIMGGTINVLVTLNMENLNPITISAPGPFYASYQPIWSKDDRWFLMVLKDEYVTSGSLSASNDEGDVYLVNAGTGDKVRLTYTPTEYEYDIHWTEDGQITFGVWRVKETTLTLEQALNVPEVPPENIITPEPIDSDDFYSPRRDITVSPDASVAAWVAFAHDEQGATTVLVLHIGTVPGYDAYFRGELPDYYPTHLIGWRPSNYPYPPG